MLDGIVKYHIKYRGWQEIPLSYPAVALEDSPAITPHIFRNLESDPVYPQDAELSGHHFIPCQDIKTAVPVQGIVGIAQVKEYGMGDCLPYGNEKV